jgi:membrane protein implicated in regulation of membrane protease activity
MALLEDSLSLLLIVIGAVLMIAEAAAPGAHLIVLGVALFVAGLIGLYGAAYGLNDPFALAALILATGAVALYIYRRFDFYGGRGAGQTSDADSLRGKRGIVTERVTDRDGEIKLHKGGFNPHYEARTEDGPLEVDTDVVVTDPGGGNVVTVRAADEAADEASAATDEADNESTATTDEGSAADDADETVPAGDET